MTAEEKLAIALEELRDAGQKLNRAWPAGGSRTLRLYEDLSGIPAYEETYAPDDEDALEAA
jgi:hypothetical protein